MTGKRHDPVALSVHDRLLSIAMNRKEDFNAILVRYGNERLLYRLSRTRHGKKFILKGAALFVVWLGRVHRSTRDLDLLATGRIDPPGLTAIFQDICAAPVNPDGLQFDSASIAMAEIRQGQAYHGVRVKLRGFLGTARLTLQADIGFGDSLSQEAQVAMYPTLLDMPAPLMRVYPRETAVAEKLDVMVERGMTNSRMKDYFDIAVLAQHFAFEGNTLQSAIIATLKRRRRELVDLLPIALTDEFGKNADKALQWKAFVSNNRAGQDSTDLITTVRQVRVFLEPVLVAISTRTEFNGHWPAAGPWDGRNA